MGHGRHASVEKKGPGLAKLQKLVADLKITPEVKIGILANEKSARSGGDMDNIEIGIINEFGAPAAGVPERSFLRSTHDAMRQAWLKLMAKTLGFAVDGKITALQALEIVGLRAAADVRRRILTGSGIPPPLAESTVAKKGSSRPLVDTRQLVNSISSSASTHGTMGKK